VAVECANSSAVHVLLEQPSIKVGSQDLYGRTPLSSLLRPDAPIRAPKIVVLCSLIDAGASAYPAVPQTYPWLSREVLLERPLSPVLLALRKERNEHTPITLHRRTLRVLMSLPSAQGVLRGEPLPDEAAVPEDLEKHREVRLSSLRADAWRRRRHLCIDRALWRKPAAATEKEEAAIAEGAKEAKAGAGE
jgi:predicted transcriptional regulator